MGSVGLGGGLSDGLDDSLGVAGVYIVLHSLILFSPPHLIFFPILLSNSPLNVSNFDSSPPQGGGGIMEEYMRLSYVNQICL